MNMLKRAIRRWLGLNQDSTYPHRFVTLVTWRDHMYGVDGNGDIYEIEFGWYDSRDFTIQLLAKNPLGGRG
jgi:hypothetical protein